MKIEYSSKFKDDLKRLFSYNPRYVIPRWFGYIKYKIKMAYQRVRYGYDDSWKWNLNSQLADIIPKCLHCMKNGVSYPAEFKNHEEWKNVLEKMAKGFEASQHLINSDYMTARKRKPTKENPREYRYYRDARRYAQLNKQCSEGMDLFKKYFFHLWD